MTLLKREWGVAKKNTPLAGKRIQEVAGKANLLSQGMEHVLEHSPVMAKVQHATRARLVWQEEEGEEQKTQMTVDDAKDQPAVVEQIEEQDDLWSGLEAMVMCLKAVAVGGSVGGQHDEWM